MGEWTLRRRIRDCTTGALGRLDGIARFIADDGLGLRFSESGTLSLGDQSAQATRDYRFEVLAPDRFRVCFADGRLFHEAEVTGRMARAAHDCAPDLYRGRYRFDGPECWRLSWRVTGPRKDLVICSVFSRSR